MSRIEAGIDAHRHADQQSEQGRAAAELESGRHALEDHAVDRLGGAVAEPEPAFRGVTDEMDELDRRRVVEAKLLLQRLAFAGGRVLADHTVDRVADITEQGEGHEPDHQQDSDRLDQASQDECEHFSTSSRPPTRSRIGAKTEPAPVAKGAGAGRLSAAAYLMFTKRSGNELSAGWTRSTFLRIAHTSACWCSGM